MNITEQIAELRANVARALGEHFRLVWLVGGTTSERSALLRAFSDAEDGIYVELGKKLSEALIDIPIPLRTASVEDCFAGCLANSDGNVSCLDQLDVLFEPSLRIDPVTLIRNASRYAMLVAAWPGTIESGRLMFGPPDHPAHLEIPERNLESLIHII